MRRTRKKSSMRADVASGWWGGAGWRGRDNQKSRKIARAIRKREAQREIEDH